MSNAELEIDLKSLDQKVIKALEAHDWIIEVLDDWILSPDNKLLPMLEKVATAVTKIQPPKLPATLWRGFHLSGKFQDKMDLVDDGWFRSKLKPGSTERPVEYKLKGPISFSTERSIAEAFGNVLVTTKTEKLSGHLLWLSDELSWLVSQRRNLKVAMTQKEVIILPSVESIFVLIESVKDRPTSATW